MRLKVFLSLTLIIVISVVGFVLLARQTAAGEVRAFMFPFGMGSQAQVREALETYYLQNGSWDGVDSLFSMGRQFGKNQSWWMGSGMMHGKGGMMRQSILVTDNGGLVILDSDGENLGRSIQLSDYAFPQSLEANGATVGYLIFEGGMAYTEADQTVLLNRLSRAGIISGIVAGAIAFAISLVLTYSLIRPVQDLTQAARKLAGGDLAQRVSVNGSDEIAILGKTFNYMASSLQKAEESRRNMTADIAHELRTPLAVQRATLEAIQDGVFPPSQENLNSIATQNQLLTRLVEDLRTLALAETNQIEFQKIPVDVIDLTHHIIDQFKPQAAMQSIELVFSGEDTSATHRRPKVNLDPLRWEQILSNLLSNALRYSQTDKKIFITVKVTDTDAVVTVRDEGDGIADVDLPYVFDRFYKADRSRHRAVGGSGLGLAITRHLVAGHDGKISANNYPTGGAEFVIHLNCLPR